MARMRRHHSEMTLVSRFGRVKAPSPTFTPPRDNRRLMRHESDAGLDASQAHPAHSMLALRLLHRCQLFRAGIRLMQRFPGLVGHAIDRLAAVVLAERHALGVGGV